MTEKGPRASGAREAGASLGQPRITDRRLLESLGSMNSSGISSVLWHNPLRSERRGLGQGSEDDCSAG